MSPTGAPKVTPTVGASMLDLTSPVRPLGTSDASLVESTRMGEPDAFLELWARHIDAVVRLARQLVSDEGAVLSVVNDAFAVVMIDIAQDRYAHHRVGSEPFRLSVYKALADLVGRPLADGPARPAVLRALHQLPPRMQAVLWYTDVEGMSRQEVELLVGEGPAEVRTAHRLARTRLQAEWVLALLDDPAVPDTCAWNLRRRSSRAAGWLSWAGARRYDRHLRDCLWCQGLGADLESPAATLTRETDRSFAAQVSAEATADRGPSVTDSA